MFRLTIDVSLYTSNLNTNFFSERVLVVINFVINFCLDFADVECNIFILI